MENDIKILNRVATVTRTQGAITAYRRNPGDLENAVVAAYAYAKKNNKNMMVIRGNSYGKSVYHIAPVGAALITYTAIRGEVKFHVATTEGEILNAMATA